MTHYEHGTLLVSITEGRPGKIDFLTTGDDETVNPESASLRRQMDALDVLSAGGWELLRAAGRHAVAGRSDEGVPAPTPEGLACSRRGLLHASFSDGGSLIGRRPRGRGVRAGPSRLRAPLPGLNLPVSITHLRESSFPEVGEPTWQPSWSGSPDSSIG